jgi:hypothetical protein
MVVVLRVGLIGGLRTDWVARFQSPPEIQLYSPASLSASYFPTSTTETTSPPKGLKVNSILHGIVSDVLTIHTRRDLRLPYPKD